MKTELKISCVMAITIATNDECVSRKSIKRPWRDLQYLSTMLWLTCRPGWQWQCTTYRSNSDWYVVQILCRPRWLSGWSVGVALRVIFWCSPHTAPPLWNRNMIFWWSWTASCEAWKIFLISFHTFSTHGRPCPPVTTAFTSAIVIPKRAPAPKTGPATQKMGLPPHNVPLNN